MNPWWSFVLLRLLLLFIVPETTLLANLNDEEYVHHRSQKCVISETGFCNQNIVSTVSDKKPLDYHNDGLCVQKFNTIRRFERENSENYGKFGKEKVSEKFSLIKGRFSRVFILIFLLFFCAVISLSLSYSSQIEQSFLYKASQKSLAFHNLLVKTFGSYEGKYLDTMENCLYGPMDKTKYLTAPHISEMGRAWSTNTFSVFYMKSSLERAASFSGFRNPSQYSLMKLSKFGFYYTKEKDLLRCSDCNALLQASHIISPPSDKKYHASTKCQYAQTGDEAVGTACTVDAPSLPNTEDSEKNDGMEASGGPSKLDGSDHMEIHKEALDSGYNSQEHQTSDNNNSTLESGKECMDDISDNTKSESTLTTQENYGWCDSDFTQQSTSQKVQGDTSNSTPTSYYTDLVNDPNTIQSCDLKLPLKSLPLGLQHDAFLSFLKTSLPLTVTISCPKQGDCNENCLGAGSAYLNDTDYSLTWLKQMEVNGQLNKDQLKIWNRRPRFYFFAVATTKHVVFDQKQALRARVNLTLDQDSEKSEIVRAIAVRDSTVDGDYTSYLVCYTPEKDVFEKLINARKELSKQANELPLKMKEEIASYSFVIISQPHGVSKKVNMISFGKSAVAKYVLTNGNGVKKLEYCATREILHQSVDSDIREILLYTAPTYPGNSGSPVFTFRKMKESIYFKLSLWIHNGIEKNTTLRGSTMKSVDLNCLPDTNPTEIKVLENRLKLIESEPRGSSSSEPAASSKPLKRGIPPLYPEYFDVKARLETYKDFKSKCSHSHIELALGGFFFTGNEDCVRCFYCGLGLKAWRKNDNLYVEHKRSRGNCAFLKLCMEWKDDVKVDLLKKGPTVRPPKDGQMTPEFTISLLSEENRILQQQRMCKMCFRRDVRELFLPCGEIHTCEECAAIISTCPSCDTKIDATVSVFMS